MKTRRKLTRHKPTLCMQITKYVILFVIFGFIYLGVELLFRGFSHIVMFLVGGISSVSVGLLNEILSWEMSLWKQSLCGGLIITFYELVTGCICNLWLEMNIWDYSDLPFNFLGQIDLIFTIAWCGLSVIAIVLDDHLRWVWFGEDKPCYKLW